MKVRPSKEIVDAMLDGLLNASALEESFGQHYMRFNSIKLEPGKRISFLLDKEAIFYIDITDIQPKDTLTLEGIEGKMKCSISC